MAEKRTNFAQSDMPRFSLEESLKLAESLRDNFASKEATPIDLANSIGRSPTSSGWRVLTGASLGYGLTSASYSASTIALTDLGRRIVAPTEEGESTQALLSALLKPIVLKAFYEKYDGQKLPKEEIVKNVLQQMQVPQERLNEAFGIIIANAKYVGILKDIGGNQFIQLRSAATTRKASIVSPLTQDTLGEAPTTSAPVRESASSSATSTNLMIIPVIEGELGIAASAKLQGKSLLNKKLAEKMQTLFAAAREFAEEWAKQDSADQTREVE